MVFEIFLEVVFIIILFAFVFVIFWPTIFGDFSNLFEPLKAFLYQRAAERGDVMCLKSCYEKASYFERIDIIACVRETNLPAETEEAILQALCPPDATK